MTTADEARLGANLEPGGVRFAVWAPDAPEVTLVLDEDMDVRMQRDADGVHSCLVADAGAGTRYAFRVGDAGPFPDPRSRFQPEGVHAASEVIDPQSFSWTDEDWPGLPANGLVIYELHVGTMTPEGTFRGLIGQLPYLRDLGINAIELMPVAECPGRWNWGYDGVGLFAPSHNYGRPNDLRALVDAAHAHGIGVILDVVYNHLGPEGNYLGVYSSQYASSVHTNSWGAGLNWDGPGSEQVRRFAIDNACDWIRDFHMDGLRLDATHAIIDDSPLHLVQELTTAVREAAGFRSVVIVAEDDRREMLRVRPVSRGGEGVDAVWADDFHHELRVLLTNAGENYFAAYSGTTPEIANAINNGFGDEWVEEITPGTPPDGQDPASAFVFCIQNHDQVGNRPFGDRLHHSVSADRYAVASALLLFAPETPLLFMGQEFAASTPFLYFTDHPEELGRLVTEGRRQEFAGFRLFDDANLRDTIPDPQAESTFFASKLNLREQRSNQQVLEMYRHLIGLRKRDPVLKHNDRSTTHAFWLTAQVVAVHRWHGEEHRLLIANFGNATQLDLRDRQLPARTWEFMFSTGATVSPGGLGEISVPARTALMFGTTAR